MLVNKLVLLVLLSPRSGNYNYANGGINNQRSNGNFWEGQANSTTNARNLNFNSTNLNPQNTNNKGNGFSVRCLVR